MPATLDPIELNCIVGMSIFCSLQFPPLNASSCLFSPWMPPRTQKVGCLRYLKVQVLFKWLNIWFSSLSASQMKTDFDLHNLILNHNSCLSVWALFCNFPPTMPLPSLNAFSLLECILRCIWFSLGRNACQMLLLRHLGR